MAMEKMSKQLQRTLDAWVQFWNTYDLDQVERLFVPDDSVTYFSSEFDGLIHGIEAMRQHHLRFGFVSGGKTTGNRLWLTDVVTQWHGEVATVCAAWHFQRAGANTSQHGPVTFVFVPHTNEYRIAHGHFANAPTAR
jgi:ketosteroid isomerase-like protein